jgi:hypothetical protein
MTSADFILDLEKYLSALTVAQMHGIREVVAHGRPYVGVGRPKGYRKRKAKQCFYNAAMLAVAGRGTYVEGYACRDGYRDWPMHHAWITLDGVHAIDPTWDDPADAYYAGIAFPTEIMARHILQQGDLVSLLTDHEPSAALRVLVADQIKIK